MSVVPSACKIMAVGKMGGLFSFEFGNWTAGSLRQFKPGSRARSPRSTSTRPNFRAIDGFKIPAAGHFDPGQSLWSMPSCWCWSTKSGASAMVSKSSLLMRPA